ncbi:7511_t:CDS:2, partial [Gigaspora margarita]
IHPGNILLKEDYEAYITDLGLNITRSEVKNTIRIEFLESDENNKKLPIIKETLKNGYTSKPYNITEINKAYQNRKN